MHLDVVGMSEERKEERDRNDENNPGNNANSRAIIAMIFTVETLLADTVGVVIGSCSKLPETVVSQGYRYY